MYSHFLIAILLVAIWPSRGKTQSTNQPNIINIPSPIAYQINSSIKKDAGKHSNSAPGMITYKAYIGDSLRFETTDSLITKAEIRHDTIMVVALSGKWRDFSFSLTLFKDSCIIAPFWVGNVVIYKINETDATWLFSQDVPAKDQIVTLVRRPNFKLGELIEGLIEFCSFNYQNSEGQSARMQFKASFKATVQESIRPLRQ